MQPVNHSTAILTPALASSTRQSKWVTNVSKLRVPRCQVRIYKAFRFVKSLSISGYPFFSELFVLKHSSNSWDCWKREADQLRCFVLLFWNNTLLLYSTYPTICSKIYISSILFIFTTSLWYALVSRHYCHSSATF